MLLSTASAESWGFKDNSVSAAVGYEEKTNDKQYEGTKFIIDAQYVLKSETGEISEKLQCCAWPSQPEYFYGLLDTEIRWELDETDLEYFRLGLTPWATMWYQAQDSSDKLQTKWDQLELGAMRYVTDDVLEVESYFELSVLRAGRVGNYSWSEKSPFTVVLGMQASAGWAWAESMDPVYSKVSNPFTGIFFNISLDHEHWGSFYTRDRFVNGFSFSSPGRGHPTAREANVRFGFIKQQVINCFALDAYIEKRSFYFNEGDLPGLYRKSGTVGLELSCYW